MWQQGVGGGIQGPTPALLTYGGLGLVLALQTQV